jgi:hypothetical protein
LLGLLAWLGVIGIDTERGRFEDSEIVLGYRAQLFKGRGPLRAAQTYGDRYFQFF